MNAIPPEFLPKGVRSAEQADRLFVRWAALSGAARVIARLAHVENAESVDDVDALLAWPRVLSHLAGRRRMLIEQAMEDLSAVMEPGLTALIDAHEAGAQTQPAAHALWQEFLRARHGLFALIPRRAMTRKAVASSLLFVKRGHGCAPLRSPSLTADAAAVMRGIMRMFARNDIWCLPEMPLRNGRRADLMGIDAKGQVIIVEIKVARATFWAMPSGPITSTIATASSGPGQPS
jgi:hypothetical protein